MATMKMTPLAYAYHVHSHANTVQVVLFQPVHRVLMALPSTLALVSRYALRHSTRMLQSVLVVLVLA